MTLFSTLCGVFLGAFLMADHDGLRVGAVIGGAIGFLLARVIKLESLVEDLTRQVARRMAGLPEGASDEAVRVPEYDEAPEHSPASTVMAAADPLAELEIIERPAGAMQASHMAVGASRAEPRPRPAELLDPPAPPIGTPRPSLKGPDYYLIELRDILVSYFTGGNVVVRVGLILLFFGVAFLLKYSAEHNLVPIEFRLMGGCLGGVALLVLGWRVRTSRPGYGLLLQGGGVGVLYLTIFGALRLYQLLPAGLALALLVALAICSAALAIVQDARALAVIGITGGFLAPVLTATGGGNHVMLFSYYALLNLGILFTAWHRSWRELNLVGFYFTFIIATVWGVMSYRPEHFASTEPFLVLFFLFYLALALLFARNQPLGLKGYIDSTLVFGTPVVSFALQAGLVKRFEYGLAWSALAMGMVYGVLAWAIMRRGSVALRTMVESFIAMAVVFGTIAIPLALDGRWTSAAWALEGAAIVWVALRQRRGLARYFGLALQPLAGVAFLVGRTAPVANMAVINGYCLGSLVISLAGLLTGYFLHRQREGLKGAGEESILALIWGLVWWFWAGFHEIDRFVLEHYEAATALGFAALSCWAAQLLAVRFVWPQPGRIYKGLLPFMLFTGLYVISHYSPPLGHGGYLAWPLAFLVHYRLLYKNDGQQLAGYQEALHIGSLLLLTGLLAAEGRWWVNHWVAGASTWGLVTLALVPCLILTGISLFWHRVDWPLTRFAKSYVYRGLAPVAVGIWLWSVLTNFTSSGRTEPLAYLPLLNPLDIGQLFVLLALGFWLLVLSVQLELQPFGFTRRQRIITMAVTTFVWLNGVLLRTLHHWHGVPFRFTSMLADDLVQTALSIFWTLAAFLVMYIAARRVFRQLWLSGAGLIGLVIVKLFLFDLANSGTVERIVSFLGVGIICLVIGYLAPLPPRTCRLEEQS